MENFVWGRVIKVHDFFGTEIIEYHPRKVKGSTVTETINLDEIMFHVENLRESFTTLDIAVIGILCNKYQGLNHHLTYPIARMLEMEKENVHTN